MKEFFRRIRAAIYLSAILTIAFGIVLIVWPLEVTGLICRVLGVLLAIMGAVYLFGYFVDGKGILNVAGGLLFLFLGAWIFVRPGSVAKLVPIVIGVVLLVHSLKDFQMASETKRNGSNRWLALLVLSFFNSVFGIVCICDSFGVLSVAVRMLGAALVYDGISDMVIAYVTVRAVRDAAAKIEPIDVEAHECE